MLDIMRAVTISKVFKEIKGKYIFLFLQIELFIN